MTLKRDSISAPAVEAEGPAIPATIEADDKPLDPRVLAAIKLTALSMPRAKILPTLLLKFPKENPDKLKAAIEAQLEVKRRYEREGGHRRRYNKARSETMVAA